jgi:hypothetical protein
MVELFFVWRWGRRVVRVILANNRVINGRFVVSAPLLQKANSGGALSDTPDCVDVQVQRARAWRV